MVPRANALLATLAMLVACGEDPEPAPAPVAPPSPQLARARPRPVDVAPPDDPRVRRLTSYLALMSVDFVVYQLLATFPDAPATSRFGTFNYQWESRQHSLRAFAPAIAVAGAAAGEAPHAPVDRAVAAYVTALAAWWPKLESLNAYYADERFVDDEFARGRREAPAIERAKTELAKLRAPMRAAVLAAWRELAHDAPESPRAIVGRSWEACVAYADRVMARASDDAVDAAISRCRHAIAPVAALPEALRGHLDDKLRRVAIDAGDDAITHASLDTAYALGELTTAYLAQWHALAPDP